jgi:hypothetical protein
MVAGHLWLGFLAGAAPGKFSHPGARSHPGTISALLARTKSVLDPLYDAVKHMALL